MSEPERPFIRNADSPLTRKAASVIEYIKMTPRLWLFRRATIWWPTWIGWCIVTGILFTSVIGWFNYGESFLASTHRVPADVLVVEGWIGRQGIRAAIDEFEQGGYRYIVASGGPPSGRGWEDKSTTYAVMAGREMMRLGIPKERLVVAASENTETRHTFESAVTVWRALRDAGIKPKDINVFTFGAHARRSALVFAKVNSQGPKIGVIGWLPTDYKTDSREFLDETLGYLYEVLFNSGRASNGPGIAIIYDPDEKFLPRMELSSDSASRP